MGNERAVLDYQVPRRSRGFVSWLLKLPRPSWMTCVAVVLTLAAWYWLHVDSAPWKIKRTFDGSMTWHGLSADGKRLLAVPTNRQTIRIFDIATGQVIRDLHRPTGAVSTAAFSPDGQRVWSVGAGPDETAYLWDVSSGQLLATQTSWIPRFGFDWLGVNYAAPFSPNGRWIASGQDQGLWIFDGHTGAVVKKLPEACFPVFSPDGRYMAALSSPPRQLRIWETQTWRQTAVFPVGSGDGVSGDDGRRIAFSPNSKMLIIGYDGEIKRWTAATNRVTPFITTTKTIWGCGFSPDGRHIVTAEQDIGDLCECWDSATGQRVSAAQMNQFPYYPSVSPDGSRAICTDKILDFPTLTPLPNCSPRYITGNPNAWLPSSESFLSSDGSNIPRTNLYQRRRPEAAYGFFWLPQTWIALAGAIISVWLIRRDVHIWRVKKAAL